MEEENIHSSKLLLDDQKQETKFGDDYTRFNKSLQELKDLSSQIHYAADYCETSYRNADNGEKKAVMENTREYICRAVVTVVDHLGSVSAQLDCRISNNKIVSETDLHITSLDQRLVSLQKYSHKLSFAKLCWNANFPKYHARYIFPPSIERPKDASRGSETKVAPKISNKYEFETEEGVPLFLYTYNHKPFLTNKNSEIVATNNASASVLPVRDGLSILSKARNPSFIFEGPRKVKRNMLGRRLVQSSIIWKSKLEA